VPEGNNLVHYWKDTCNGNNPWKPDPQPVSTRATGPGSLIQSTFGSCGGNFEVVVREGRNLVHYWKDTCNGNNRWNYATVISYAATGAGSLVQSTFGACQNFEAAVPEANNLVHYWKDTCNGSNPWKRDIITPSSTGPASLTLRVHIVG
jgi:hypothetical protein